jgi:hypothetical protein
MRSIHGGSTPWSSIVIALETRPSWRSRRGPTVTCMMGCWPLLRARDLADQDGFKATRSWLCAYGRMSQGAATGWLQPERVQTSSSGRRSRGRRTSGDASRVVVVSAVDSGRRRSPPWRRCRHRDRPGTGSPLRRRLGTAGGVLGRVETCPVAGLGRGDLVVVVVNLVDVTRAPDRRTPDRRT